MSVGMCGGRHCLLWGARGRGCLILSPAPPHCPWFKGPSLWESGLHDRDPSSLCSEDDQRLLCWSDGPNPCEAPGARPAAQTRPGWLGHLTPRALVLGGAQAHAAWTREGWRPNHHPGKGFLPSPPAPFSPTFPGLCMGSVAAGPPAPDSPGLMPPCRAAPAKLDLELGRNEVMGGNMYLQGEGLFLEPTPHG